MNAYIIPGIKSDLNTIAKAINAQSFDEIVQNVAQAWGVNTEHVLMRSNKNNHVLPRMTAMFLVKEKLNLSTTQTGALFNRTHATVIHACKTIKNEYETNKDYKKKILTLLFQQHLS